MSLRDIADLTEVRGLRQPALKDSPKLSFRGAVGDEESRISFSFKARFLAPLGMTRFHKVFQQAASLDSLALACRRGDGKVHSALGRELATSAREMPTKQELR